MMLSVASHQGKVSQNHSEISPHIHRDGHYQGKKWKLSSDIEDAETLESMCTVAGMQNGAKLPWKTVRRFLLKPTMQLLCDPAIPLLVQI